MRPGISAPHLLTLTVSMMLVRCVFLFAYAPLTAEEVASFVEYRMRPRR